jgi:hypothetical protein
MNDYQNEQLNDFVIVTKHLETISVEDKKSIANEMEEYLLFRRQVDNFFSDNCAEECTQKCFQSRLSACCSKDSIITFFADFLVNVLFSEKRDVDQLMDALKQPNTGYKCVYLGKEGCRWKVKPIVCAVFLCNKAKEKVFHQKPGLKDTWEKLLIMDKKFRWPDRPVLFDRLEQYFIDAGYDSPSMYLHNSPGLLNVKRRAEKTNP